MADADLVIFGVSGTMENFTTPDHKAINMACMVIYCVVCVLGVSGNGAVMWVTGIRMEKSPSSVWYLNLAVADFLVSASLPLAISQRALYGRWPSGWLTCKVDRLVLYMNMYARFYTLVVILVDRCVNAACPEWARRHGARHRTVRNASGVSLGVWAIALAASLQFGNCWDSLDLRLVVANFVVGFAAPFSAIAVCYSVIVCRLRRNDRSLEAGGSSGRSFKIVAAVIATFFLCWIPFHAVLLFEACYAKVLRAEDSDTLDLVLSYAYPVTFTMALGNSCVNPLLYLFSQGFVDVFRCRMSILKVLERALAEEEPPQNNNNNTPTITVDSPGVTRSDLALSEIEGSTGPPGS